MHHRFVCEGVHRHVCQDVTDVTVVIAGGRASMTASMRGGDCDRDG